jgi:hypothetical protein
MAFEWDPAKESALYESWWTNTLLPTVGADVQEMQKTRGISLDTVLKEINDIKLKDRILTRQTIGASSGYAKYQTQWNSYLNSYLQTQVQQGQQQAEAERAAQQAQIAKAEQDYATAAKQAEESQIQAKRISAVADYQGQQIVEQARQASALAMQSEAQPVQGRKKTQIGQPGVSRTRVSSGIGIGGYGGTSAGNVNPTGLNI